MRQPEPWKDMSTAAKAMTIVLYLAAGTIVLIVLGLLAKAVKWAWS